MTYCVAMLLDTGLVFLSDSRTNAGIDQISTFRKATVFQKPGDRVLVLQSSGNLAITQTVISMLKQDIDAAGSKGAPTRPTLMNVPNLFEAARCVGDALRELHKRDANALKEFGVEFNAGLTLGGQIKGRRLRLFMIYSAGNFIEATADTPYLQIGEHKYGKPVLDRAVTYDTDLYDALKIGLISMDSTMRSNLGVGLPIDTLVLRRDTLKPELSHRIDADDAYFTDLRHRWSEALRAAHLAIPRPPYKSGG